MELCLHTDSFQDIHARQLRQSCCLNSAFYIALVKTKKALNKSGFVFGYICPVMFLILQIQKRKMKSYLKGTHLAGLSQPAIRILTHLQTTHLTKHHLLNLGRQVLCHDATRPVCKNVHVIQKRKEKKRNTTQAAKHSLHQLRKRRHTGPKCRESPPPCRTEHQ